MIYTLVRKTKTEGEFAKSETFTELDEAKAKYWLYLSNNALDKSVKRFDITILNDSLIPCMTDHFIREEPPTEAETL